MTKQQLKQRGKAISIAKTGKKLPAMSKALMGHVVSDFTKKKISLITSGKQHWNWGKQLSIKTKKKIADAHQGMKHKPETIAKLRALKGPLNSRWKNGITKENDKLRRQWQAKQWRKKVIVRDHFVCQLCKEKFSSSQLVAHHIKSWAKYPKLRYEIENGKTLCKTCHLKIHHWKIWN